MEAFLQYLKKLYSLTEDSFDKLKLICEVRTIPKNEYVLKDGELCGHIYFVNTGLLRIFYYKHGKDISEWFAFEKSFCFSITSYFMQVPSKLIIQPIEDSEVIFISREGLETLRKTDFILADFYFNLISRSLMASQDRMEAIQFESASQRYENLLRLHKNFLQRVPLHYIASYLGVSPETLSRIRAQIH